MGRSVVLSLSHLVHSGTPRQHLFLAGFSLSERHGISRIALE
jgi:hypothetical protein